MSVVDENSVGASPIVEERSEEAQSDKDDINVSNMDSEAKER